MQKFAVNFIVERGGKLVENFLGKKAITGLKYSSKLKTNVINFSKNSATPSRISQTTNTYSTAAQGTEKAEQFVLKEHGLSEIMSDTVHTPTKIGQTPVHSPLAPKLPEHYIKVEGEVIPYEYDAQGRLATSYKITPSNPREYTEIFETRFVDGKPERVSLGSGKYVQFYDEEGRKVGARIKVQRTSIMTREEVAQYLEDLKKNPPKAQSVIPKTPVETPLEKSINGLNEPQRTAQRLIKLDEDGNTIVRFVDDKGYFLRKVKLNPNGEVLEYTNFRTLVSGQGINGGGFLTGQQNGCSYSSVLTGEHPIESVQQFDEVASRYMRVREQSRYILNSKGEVERTIQTRRFTPHIHGNQSGEPVQTLIDARSMGHGKFVEDVIITKKDKRFSRSFWFDQKSGNIHQMDGWCKGLTKEEIELIKSDPFLASRYYNDGLDFARAEKFNAYNTQNLRDKETPLLFNNPTSSSELGHYRHRRSWVPWETSHINMTPDHIVNGSRGSVVDTMHHESRHGFQHQMVDDLNKNMLQGEEKAQAQIFADNFARYNCPEKGIDAYFKQPVEVDARKAGEAAQKQFDENGKKIDNIFFSIA